MLLLKVSIVWVIKEAAAFGIYCTYVRTYMPYGLDCLQLCVSVKQSLTSGDRKIMMWYV